MRTYTLEEFGSSPDIYAAPTCPHCKSSMKSNIKTAIFVCGFQVKARACSKFYEEITPCPTQGQTELNIVSSHPCTCDMFTVLLRSGCQCGGV